MKKLHYRKEKFLTVTIYKIHSVSVAIFKKINLKFYFLKGIRVHPNKRTYAPIGCTRSVLVCRIYLSVDSYLMIILDSFAYETFKEDNLKIISSILEKLKITLINQKAVIK